MFKPVVLVTPGSWASEIAEMLEGAGIRTILRNHFGKLASDYRRASHVLLTGGADIDPAYYNHPLTYARPCEPERDRAEMWLADLALLDRKPTMGICRGHQIITVAAGGTLYQDNAMELRVDHSETNHYVYARPGTRLRQLIGEVTLVNSYHHQSVCHVPQGWRVAAYAPDGVIEAIEHPTLPVISIQWHPEALATNESVALFTKFLQMRPPASFRPAKSPKRKSPRHKAKRPKDKRQRTLW